MICNSSNFLKIIPDVKTIRILSKVHPDMTPNIVGIVFVKPKLNAEYDVTILLGPGENPAAMPNRINGTNSSSIA